MKKLIIVSLILFPSLSKVNAQDSTYNIGSYSDEGVKAPNVHDLGDAWLNFLVKADTDFDYNITQATFSPNSTLDWHKHSTAQVIIVVEGEGYYQERGKDPIIIKKGDVNEPTQTQGYGVSMGNNLMIDSRVGAPGQGN